MSDTENLRQTLSRIDGRSYRAYRSLAENYRFPGFDLTFEHIQGDPFAAPSLLSVRIPFAESGLPGSLVVSSTRRIAGADFLARVFRDNLLQHPPPTRGSGGSGRISIDAGGQEVLERSCLLLDQHEITCRFFLGLPARGRRILGREAVRLLLDLVPRLVHQSLRFEALDAGALQRHAECVEDQVALRSQLDSRGLVAFIANGSVLPRRSGVDDRPLSGSDSIPFESPEEFEMSLDTPNAGPIRGMGIPCGVTLIVGGGFHGKTTLLRSIERGVYDHIPGDGREGVVAVSNAVKIRAEDGRSVQNVDISPFINRLPIQIDTHHFSSENASGSTSQAANIIEALELGCHLLLIDEDTSATNFIIRDARMQALVSQAGEPITPLIDQVRALHQRLGVSSILVMGGSGDYFDVADRVVRMSSYRARDASEQARRIALEYPSRRHQEGLPPLPEGWKRYPRPESFDARRGRRPNKISARGLVKILYGRTEIDLSALEQLVDPSQTRAIGLSIHQLSQGAFRRGLTLSVALQEWEEQVDEQGLDSLSQRVEGSLARPRRMELGAAINRLRTLRMR